MKKIVTYSIIVSAALVIGVSGGVVVKRVLTPEQEVYGNFNPQAFKPNGEKIVEEIENYRGSDFENVFSANKLINYALQKYRDCENCYSFCYGIAHTVIEQDIRNCQIKNGENYFEDSTSKSDMVAVSNRMYQNGKEGTIDLYHSNDKSKIHIDGESLWTEFGDQNPTNYTQENYSSLFGRTLDEMFIYLICNETIINSNVKKENNEYIIDVDLDPKFATYNYKIQMYNISGLDCLPSFSGLHLTFTLTNLLQLKRLHCVEDYVATMVFSAPTQGVLDYYYFPNEFLKIPEVNETINFHKS